jgi:hypothetical protein
MRSAPNAERAFFPLDEQLALLPGGLTPFLHECLVRLGAWVPFAVATELLEALLGVQISPAQGRRITEAAGAAYVTVQTQEAERIEREAPEAEVGAEKMIVSVDGAMVPLRQGEWAEVKTLVVGEVLPAVQEKEAWVVHTRSLSYFSRLASAERFAQLSFVELHRRGVENAAQLGAVMDGAEWQQGFVDYHCPHAVRILDFPHAGQRIGQVGEVLWGEGSAQTRQWTSERLHQLKHQGPEAILSELRELQVQHADRAVIAENLGYLEKRQAQMQYPAFQTQGWPIGSGIVESGNKLVVEVRLKGAGMHWERANVNPMLGLRNIVCSDRWSEEWPVIARQLRQQAQERRNQNREKRRSIQRPGAAEVSESPPLRMETGEPPKPVQNPLPEKPTSSGPRKPAANHPWRRSPIGRALYEPSKNAKK